MALVLVFQGSVSATKKSESSFLRYAGVTAPSTFSQQSVKRVLDLLFVGMFCPVQQNAGELLCVFGPKGRYDCSARPFYEGTLLTRINGVTSSRVICAAGCPCLEVLETFTAVVKLVESRLIDV